MGGFQIPTGDEHETIDEEHFAYLLSDARGFFIDPRRNSGKKSTMSELAVIQCWIKVRS